MPSALTNFAATYLVFIDAAVALAAVALDLYRRPFDVMLRWLLAVGITAVAESGSASTVAAFQQANGGDNGEPTGPLIPQAADCDTIPLFQIGERTMLSAWERDRSTRRDRDHLGAPVRHTHYDLMGREIGACHNTLLRRRHQLTIDNG